MGTDGFLSPRARLAPYAVEHNLSPFVVHSPIRQFSIRSLKNINKNYFSIKFYLFHKIKSTDEIYAGSIPGGVIDAEHSV